MENYHLGQEIRKEAYKQNLSVIYIADKIGCNRHNIYNVFTRKSMDTELLMKISRILHRNFLGELSKIYEDEGKINQEGNQIQ